jgi:hypothetical protein
LCFDPFSPPFARDSCSRLSGCLGCSGIAFGQDCRKELKELRNMKKKTPYRPAKCGLE